jgi:alpha-D-xyloside xylohydrolase
MRRKEHIFLPLALLVSVVLAGCTSLKPTLESDNDRLALILPSKELPEPGSLKLDDLFFETAGGKTILPSQLDVKIKRMSKTPFQGTTELEDGRKVTVSIKPEGDNFIIKFNANPNEDVIKWGFAIDAKPDEYFTGLMERVVDGPQQNSWAPGITEAMNLHGQKVEMILKPTLSVYAPFYLSSRGYGVFAKTDWPGMYDFCASDPKRVQIAFEGPSLEVKIYTSDEPVEIVREHAIDAGPPVLPPKWIYGPWRWRDEHRIRSSYYDGTPWDGPFNAEVMEDVLMMKAFEIPCSIYWIDRPYGPGPIGYDDFDIDPKRLPNFTQMVKWLNAQGTQMVLWIAPFFQGQMMKEALAKDYILPGQRPRLQNYPLCDFTNPKAKAYWQKGFAKLLKLGVAGFKLDRAEEDIPESGPLKVYDGRSIRENRNAYPPMYTKAAYETAKKYRGKDFVLMPRAAYTGSSPYAVFWGGDIGGTQEGLRASIIAVQRSAVMGYPNWGSDTCGYNEQLMEQEVCGRWLAFSCFTPIMEVGPTRDKGFWNIPRGDTTEYDEELIAIWRVYARLHLRLADYSYKCAKTAHKSGMPIVRPLFLIEPDSPEAWSNWWTYQYGPDLLVSPIWKKQQRTQQIYLPAGEKWRDAWREGKIYDGGQTITVDAELHQIPLFIRVGSDVQVGDLNREYKQSKLIVKKRPNLEALEARVKAWFEKNK